MRPYCGMRHNMAWSKIQDNSRRASTGASTSSFVRRIGSLRTTFSRSAALEKLLRSLASLMLQSFFGCESTASSEGRYQRQGQQNFGGRQGQTIQCGTALANSTRTGAVASRQIVKPSTQAKSGNLHVVQCGHAIKQPANGADLFTTQTPASRFTSITSNLSRSRSCEQKHQTCCLFVRLAINGSIQEGM